MASASDEAQELQAQDAEAEDSEAEDLEAEDLEAEDLEAEDLEAEDLEAEDLEAEDSEAEDLGGLLDRLSAQTDPRTPAAPRDPVPASAMSRRLAGVVIAVLAAHGLLLAALDRLERAPAQAKPFEEIAVDLVTTETPEPSKEQKPKDDKAREQKIQKQKVQEQKVQEQKSQEASPLEQKAPEEKPKEEAAKPEPAKPAEARSQEAKQSEIKPEAAPPSEPPKQEAPKQEAPKPETAKQEAAQEPPKAEPPQQKPAKPPTKAVAKGAGSKPAVRSASPTKTAAANPEGPKAEPPRPEPASPPPAPPEAQDPARLAVLRQPSAGAPPQEPAASAIEGTRSIPSGYNFLPDNFRVLAVPQSSADGEDRLPYSTLVFSRLELSKHYPEAARARGAKGSAGIGFTLDDKGNVLDVELLVPSGDADLDGESVAMVRRAAPFPAPPPGGQRRFDVIVTFDGN